MASRPPLQTPRAPLQASRAPPARQEPTQMDVDDSLPAVAAAPLQQQAAALPPVGRRPPVVPAEVEPSFPPSLLHIPDPGASGPPPSLADRTLAVLPPAWAPIIARDTAEARGVQPPYSEAYLSGQPNKRRKLNCDKKPRGDVENIISRSLQVGAGRKGWWAWDHVQKCH